jgi:hypothetical protein
VSMKFTDQSSVSIKTLTREEGVKVILELCKLVNPKYYPAGGCTEKNISINEPNEGKKNRLHGVKLKPYKAEYYLFGKEAWEWAHNIN